MRVGLSVGRDPALVEGGLRGGRLAIAGTASSGGRRQAGAIERGLQLVRSDSKCTVSPPPPPPPAPRGWFKHGLEGQM